MQERAEPESSFPEKIFSVVVEVALTGTAQAAWRRRLVLGICFHAQAVKKGKCTVTATVWSQICIRY